MIKYFVLTIHLLGVFLLSFFTDQEISINMNAPDTVQAGEEFNVTLTIAKGDIQSFSRFSQNLPYGLTAVGASSVNADFTFEEQRIRMIWLKLPPDDTLLVTYTVKVNERLKGSFNLNGEFAFIEENERKTLEVSKEDQITILPDPDIDPELIVDIDDFENVILQKQKSTESTKALAIKRRTYPRFGTDNLIVELTITKNELDKFAKVEERIPEGFRAIEGNSNNGIFSFNEGLVKILWMNLPEESEFKVNYEIIPKPGTTANDLNIKGSFSYINGNETKVVEIQEKNYDLAVIEQEEEQNQVVDTEKEQEVKEEAVTLPEKPRLAESVEGVDERYILQPESGVYYRVQLAAGHSPVNIEQYFAKRKVEDQVKLEFHKGWRKYTTGSFYVYKDARDYRVKIWNETVIDDAFVSAYNNGKRITVQEALLTTDQKWVR